MFAFLKRFFLKRKAKKILSYTLRLEKSMKVFMNIDYGKYENSDILCELSKEHLYDNIISRYNVCIRKAEGHNVTIKALTFAYNSLMETCPVSEILENITEYGTDRMREISDIINSVYEYSFPSAFAYRVQYDSYRKGIEYVIDNYELIREQKNLLLSIKNIGNTLPDIYIDNERAAVIMQDAEKSIKKFDAYERKFYAAPVVDKNLIESHNRNFIERHLKDEVFDDVNGKSLDEEQRRAVLCDSESNLTIAGAGSGKTLTICGKVKYLLRNNIASADEIMLLSYSRASANDLEDKVSRISDKLSVETFHSLGLKIITENSGTKKAIEEQLKSYIVRFFEEETIKNPEIANIIFNYIALFFYSYPIDKFPYKDDGELFRELKSIDYKTMKCRLEELSENSQKHETLKKEHVKSNEELVIANYLFVNGIKYEYERPYEVNTSTPDKRQYMPDFYLPDYGIYLEHYGVDRNGDAVQYSGKKRALYKSQMIWKRATHVKYKTKCIETYSYEFREGTIFKNLKSRLLSCGVKFNPLSQDKIFKALHNIHAGMDFTSFVNLILTFISLYKSQNTSDKAFDELKKQILNNKYDTARAHIFYEICRDIYNYYITNLRAADKIDFDDMILQAIELLDHTPNFKYKYIIVDEFQDISQSRTKFLQKLMEHGKSKLFAVGDDWQAIYRFAGCDINVFLDFQHIFPGAKLNYITSTHRNSAELQNIVEPFITANPEQYKKHIRSDKHQDKPVRIIYYHGDKPAALTLALTDINKINPCAHVLILGRNRRDIDFYVCKYIKVFNYSTVRHISFPEMKLKYSTVHGAKGLESEFVILINGDNAKNGFPNKIEDDSVLLPLLGAGSNFEYAEERRLFYVALTRTRSIVYLLADIFNPSCFIKEIENKCYIIKNDIGDSENVYYCPWCKSGYLVKRRFKKDGSEFYGCSNYPFCTYTNSDMIFVQFNRRCPVCGDFLTIRNGSHGLFIGCHNYPRCDYTEQITSDNNTKT